MKYTLILLFVLNLLYSQKIEFPDNYNKPLATISYDVLDTSNLNVFYKVSFIEPLKDKRKEAICLLEIGSKVVKFQDYNSLKYDSILMNLKNVTPQVQVNELLKYRINWKNIVLSENGKITIQDKAFKMFEYEDNSVLFDWKISSEKKIISNYNCNKATTIFRGRNYTAWFTNQIPLSNGPFVFRGLPGLILEISDDDSEFSFEMIGLNKDVKNIYKKTNKNIIKTTREKFRTAQKSFLDNPSFYFGDSYDNDGSTQIQKPKKSKYNLLEIE
ncbi:MAG: GLPGLI family protein [Bacteroidetes bacterium]|nr:GLPGLI family protein [Bacteroidota bacterium]